MPDSEVSKDISVVEPTTASGNPLIFISHDGRDAELAEAFGKLLKSVSAGMIKPFRSSDKKGSDGIDFGEEWYNRLMDTLQKTSDVVCLFTERSISRPWILFEAGVAKGKLNTPVIGLACGIPLSKVSAGPFYQFHNMDDSEAELTKLVQQLARRVPGCELDADVVKAQVAMFKQSETEILKKLGGTGDGQEATEENAVAKLAEEMKALPSRVAERLADFTEGLPRRRRFRRFHPMMLDELMHVAGDPDDPVAILMVASLVRDEAPWLYELALEVYRAVKSGDRELIETEIRRVKRLSETLSHGPFLEEFGDKETYILLREFPRALYRTLDRTLAVRTLAVQKPPRRRRTTGGVTGKSPVTAA